MPLNLLAYIRATIINMYFYLKIIIFYSRLFQNTQQNACSRETLPNISLRELINFLKTKSDPI